MIGVSVNMGGPWALTIVVTISKQLHPINLASFILIILKNSCQHLPLTIFNF